MRIVADANIVAVADYFRRHGELILLPGRSITAADVRHADVLLVRSITRVDRALLEGSRVQFVATATSGTDHLDLDYLAESGIAVADAAGSNANAVVEYCLAGMAELICSGKFSLRNKSVAIIGFGHVGRGLYRKLRSLGIACVVCDPFVAAQEEKSGLEDVVFCSLQQALSASVISLHTPLTRDGMHPTYHLLNAKRIAALCADTLLINTSRGEVVDNAALCRRLQDRSDILTLWDVWENEPDISRELLACVSLASPHIAGYSVEAKSSASEMNYRSFLHHFGITGRALTRTAGEERELLEPANLPEKQSVHGQGDWDEICLAECLRAALSVAAIDQRLRARCQADSTALFDTIRQSLVSRREFAHFYFDRELYAKGYISDTVALQLNALGFEFL